VIGEGEKAAKAKDDNTAKAAYEKALTGASDPDQVDAIAAALGKLGVKVNVQKHLGFVNTWHLAAPFDHRKGVGWDVAYPPEKGVDLNKAIGKYKDAVAYAYAVVESDKERAVELRFGSINAVKVFLNGKQVFAREEYHHGAHVDQYAARARLKKGRNEILLKLCQNEQKEEYAQVWHFQLRLTDHAGSAVPFTQPEPKEAK